MGKFVVANDLYCCIVSKNNPASNRAKKGWSEVYFRVMTPMVYTLRDITDMIKMYTGYTGKYGWSFENEYEPEKNFTCNDNDKMLDEIEFEKFKRNTPEILCEYGQFKMTIGARGYKKYTKVYPTDFFGEGTFPTEDEIVLGVTLKDEYVEVSEEKGQEFLKKLQAHFKAKYKMTDEIVDAFYGEQNALVKKNCTT